MITLIVFTVRRPDLNYKEFSEYWIDRHAPLVKSVPEFMRHVRKYVQHHRASGDELGTPFGNSPDYDGVCEIWFDSRATMKAAFEEPRYLEIIRPDEQLFLDVGRCLSFIGDEHIMADTKSLAGINGDKSS